MSGPHYGQAMQHLQTLNLAELIKSSGTDKFSHAIQRYLRHKYQIDSAGSEATALPDSERDAPHVEG